MAQDMTTNVDPLDEAREEDVIDRLVHSQETQNGELSYPTGEEASRPGEDGDQGDMESEREVAHDNHDVR